MTVDTILGESCCSEKREVTSASRKDELGSGGVVQTEACLPSMREALVPVITTT